MTAPDGPYSSAVVVEELAAFGIVAFTTTRAAGSFGLGTEEPVGEVMDRWSALMSDCRSLGAPSLVSAGQVHGAEIAVHGSAWRGLLRGHNLDGHATAESGVALAVTIADCTPVFLVHPTGPIALLHAGWRGTAAGILEAGVGRLALLGAPPEQMHVHLGPSICGRCYEVGVEVIAALTGRTAHAPEYIDVRAQLASRALALGVARVSQSTLCTRCNNSQLFSHRAGDVGRQLAVLLRPTVEGPTYSAA